VESCRNDGLMVSMLGFDDVITHGCTVCEVESFLQFTKNVPLDMKLRAPEKAETDHVAGIS
jgi:hypothetical protein